jgi:hypothetical protein
MEANIGKAYGMPESKGMHIKFYLKYSTGRSHLEDLDIDRILF